MLRCPVKHHGSGNDPAFVQQLLDGGSLKDGCACLPSSGEQLMVENSPRD
jgi:hypothetical protein